MNNIFKTLNLKENKKAKIVAISIVGVVVIVIILIFFAKVFDRHITAEDRAIPPLIALAGKSEMNIAVGSSFNDPGASATDNLDGDITNNISVGDDIDINTIGTYKVTYAIQDSDNNISQAQRIVNVIQPNLDGIPILKYQSFFDPANRGSAKNAASISINNFEQQIKYLKDNKWTFPTWAELNDYLDGTDVLPNKSIVLTADGGDDSLFSLAYPILKKYKIPMTAFIVTSITSKPHELGVDKRIIKFESNSNDMNNLECSNKKAGLITCIDDQAGLDDISKSKQIIGKNLVFSYPFGSYNDHAKKLLKAANYKMAVTNDDGKAKPKADKLALPRVPAYTAKTLDEFVSLIK